MFSTVPSTSVNCNKRDEQGCSCVLLHYLKDRLGYVVWDFVLSRPVNTTRIKLHESVFSGTSVVNYSESVDTPPVMPWPEGQIQELVRAVQPANDDSANNYNLDSSSERA